MWGMMLGFSGINHTARLYLARLPDYLQTAYNLDLKSTGFMAAIPLLFGAAGMPLSTATPPTGWSKAAWRRSKPQNLHHCWDVLLRRVYA